MTRTSLQLLIGCGFLILLFIVPFLARRLKTYTFVFVVSELLCLEKAVRGFYWYWLGGAKESVAQDMDMARLISTTIPGVLQLVEHLLINLLLIGIIVLSYRKRKRDVPVD